MRQAEIHIGDHRGLVRIIRFDVDKDERVERIVIPSEFGDKAVQVVPFRETFSNNTNNQEQKGEH